MNIRIVVTHHAPVVIYSFLGLGFMAQGVRYLAATELMPYHMEVIQIAWQGLAGNQQQLLLGLLKGFGAGSLGMGVAIILLALIPLRAKQPWAYLVTPLVTAIYVGAITYVTMYALLPGAIPITVSLACVGLVALAWVSSIFRVRA